MPAKRGAMSVRQGRSHGVPRPRPRTRVTRSARRVLVAGTPEAASLARAVLGDEAKVVAVYSVQDALSELVAHGPFDCVVCSLRFEEARMFEFLYSLRTCRQRAASRVVYVHACSPQLSEKVRPAIETALQALGVAAFLDFAALVAEQGEPAARDTLRQAILGGAASPSAF